MTTTRLIEELSAQIKKTLCKVRLPEESERELSVNVFANYLPKEAFEDTSYLPYVCVEFLNLTDDLKDGSTVQIGLTVATYAETADGWRGAFHIVEMLRQSLLARPVIARRFRLIDAQWEPPQGSQPLPFYYLVGVLEFSIYQPTETF